MRTDTIFYQLFQTFPSLLFELIGEPVAEAQSYQFSSVEIKELAFRADGLFLPETSGKPIYFAEVQFQPKDDFYWRFISEIFLYLGQYKPEHEWFAVAIFASRSLDVAFPLPYRILDPQVKRVYLDELGAIEPTVELDIVKLVVTPEVRVEQVNLLTQQARDQFSDLAVKQKVIELIQTILVYKFTQLSRQEIEAMFGLDEIKQTRYFREVAEDFKQEGILEGKLEGILEGKLEGKLETVSLLLRLGLSVEQIAQELGLDIEIVRQTAQTDQSDRN